MHTLALSVSDKPPPEDDNRGVIPVGAAPSEDTMLAGLRAGEPAARAAFVERYHHYVERLVTRVLGFDQDIPDLVQDVFLAALSGVGRFRGEPAALSTWLGQIAIRTARLCIRKRRSHRWLDFRPPARLDDFRAASLAPDDRQVLLRTYAVLDRLPAKERVVFVLRFVEGMEVTEVAALCEISPATVKRRTHSAHERFWRLAGRDPVLREWCNDRGMP